MNWPPVPSLVVFPNTETQKRERNQTSALPWYSVRLTAPPVKPCSTNAMQKRSLPFLHSSEHSEAAISEVSVVGKNQKRVLKMPSQFLEISPCHSCPGGLPQACLSLHSLPWHQPCLAPLASLGCSPHHSPPEETRNRFHARAVGKSDYWVKRNLTSPEHICASELTSLSPSAESWSSCWSPRGVCRKGQGVTYNDFCLYFSIIKLKPGWHEVRAYLQNRKTATPAENQRMFKLF